MTFTTRFISCIIIRGKSSSRSLGQIKASLNHFYFTHTPFPELWLNGDQSDSRRDSELLTFPWNVSLRLPEQDSAREKLSPRGTALGFSCACGRFLFKVRALISEPTVRDGGDQVRAGPRRRGYPSHTFPFRRRAAAQAQQGGETDPLRNAGCHRTVFPRGSCWGTSSHSMSKAIFRSVETWVSIFVDLVCVRPSSGETFPPSAVLGNFDSSSSSQIAPQLRARGAQGHTSGPCDVRGREDRCGSGGAGTGSTGNEQERTWVQFLVHVYRSGEKGSGYV